jgi:predicted GNAT family N-acyltransferase
MDTQRPLAGRACTLHLYTQDGFDAEIEALRRSDFELAAGTTRVRDAFDDCSTYVLARVSDELVGTVRITQPAGALRDWLPDPGQLPMAHGPEVVEFTRGVVARRWRGLGIYQLLMCATVLRASETATVAIAAVEPFLHVRGFLRLLGFQECGRPLIFHDGPGCQTLAQGMELDLATARAIVPSHMASLKSRLQSKRIEVVGLDALAQ